MKVAFFLGSVDISGGSYVVYQHALHAQRVGHDITIVVLNPYVESQMRWHPATRELRFVPITELGEEYFDLAVATWWKTATELHAINAGQYAYFVQSIESRFYAEAEAPLRALVDSTYNLGLPTVTEASWIRQHLADRHTVGSALVKNGIRKDLYTAEGGAVSPRLGKGKLRVLVEGPFGVFFKNVGSSLRLARQSHADETWLLTSTELGWYPRVGRVFSRVPIDSVPHVYRSCDVILKLSYVEGMFGPPLEMFHCGGTAVVYDVTGHDEYIEHSRNALVLPRDDEAGVRQALDQLRDDPAMLEKLKVGALNTAQSWPDWPTSSTEFEASLRAFLEQPRVERRELTERNQDFMATYVRTEQARLAMLDRRPKFRDRVIGRIDSFPKVARLRRLGGYIHEGWRRPR